jgi:hypothetical protein
VSITDGGCPLLFDWRFNTWRLRKARRLVPVGAALSPFEAQAQAHVKALIAAVVL